MQLTNLLLAALATGAFAIPTTSHVKHEKRDEVPRTWTKRVRATYDVVPVRIGMTQQNLDRGHDLLMEVSDHKSPKYGQWYTPEEIHDLFAPSPETVDAVRGWLESAGIAKDRISQSVNKQWMQFDASIAELEDLVKAKYYVYEHESGKHHTACDEYHVPDDVQPHIDYITPGIKLFHPSSPAKRSAGVDKRGEYKLPPLLKPAPPVLPDPNDRVAALAQCDSVITPACIKAMYNITDNPKTVASGNELGIFESLGDHYTQQDLNDFFKAVYPKIPQGTHPIPRLIDGAIAAIGNVSAAGLESDLDFEISYPIIWPQQSVLFQTDDEVYQNNYTYAGFLNNFLDAIDGSYCSYSAFGQTGNSKLDPPYPNPAPGGYKGKLQCGVYKPTNVISISYGGLEIGLPVSYQRRQCSEFMKLGMQGVSICVSSGDSGVAGRDGDFGPGKACAGPVGGHFVPDFPANCPYLTTLGATFIPPGGSAAKDEEVAVTRFGSGGGFSNIFPIPKYQADAVNGYLTKYPPPYNSYTAQYSSTGFGFGAGRFNNGGRGFPDFAAVGDNVLIHGKGRSSLIGGTSASSPAFAAILVRINEERIKAGKSTIGFVNPLLYAHPEVFHDITVGTNNHNNDGCNTNGFSCAPGWDPVTGLGTPNYPAMLKVFMAQP